MTGRDRWWFLAGMYFGLGLVALGQLVHFKAAKTHAVVGQL